MPKFLAIAKANLRVEIEADDFEDACKKIADDADVQQIEWERACIYDVMLPYPDKPGVRRVIEEYGDDVDADAFCEDELYYEMDSHDEDA